MITLTSPWNSGVCTFPAGTVFISARTTKRGTVYTYGTPNGGHGETLVYKGTIPGGSNS